MKFSGSGNSAFSAFFKHYKKTEKSTKNLEIKEKPAKVRSTPNEIASAKKLAHELMQLRESTSWEEKIKKKLSTSGLKFEEKFRTFPLQLDEKTVFQFIPDFIIKDLIYKNKKILVEAFDHFTENDAIKLRLFMETYGKIYFLILVVRNEELDKWNKLSSTHNPLFNEIWIHDDLNELITYLKYKMKPIEEEKSSTIAKCPLPKGCGKQAKGETEIEKLFGYRNMGNGVIRVQSYCRRCRNKERRLERHKNQEMNQKYEPKEVFCTGCGNKFITSDPSQSHCNNCLKIFEN